MTQYDHDNDINEFWSNLNQFNVLESEYQVINFIILVKMSVLRSIREGIADSQTWSDVTSMALPNAAFFVEQKI